MKIKLTITIEATEPKKLKFSELEESLQVEQIIANLEENGNLTVKDAKLELD